MKKLHRQASPEFMGRSSRGHRARIKVTEFQEDSNGRRDKALTWRVRGGTQKLSRSALDPTQTLIPPAGSSIVSVEGSVSMFDAPLVTWVAGALWQGFLLRDPSL